jgi:stearoyl-CoA desaturase (delta-9 desaturase)
VPNSLIAPTTGRARITVSSAALRRRQVTHFVVVNGGSAVLAAAAVAWGFVHGVGAAELVPALTMGLLTAIGVEIGFHRLMAHGAFKVSPRVKQVFCILGMTGGQGDTAYWIANHRRHHAYVDTPDDPHSPSRGLGHAHMGWLLDREVTLTPRFAADILRDPTVRAVDRRYHLWLALGLMAPTFAGGLIAGSLSGLVGGFLWGGGLRLFVAQHMIFSVNSLCHAFGERPFQTSAGTSRNIRWLALPSLGGSLHNNHHAFPNAHSLAFGPGEVDPGGTIIRLLAHLGLARDLVIASPEAIAAKSLPARGHIPQI